MKGKDGENFMLYPVVGIVAEYNPFHKGHLLHIRRARELCGAQAAVAVLSSDFVQRGEPALADKWTRAKAALACGADLVLELPVLFSAPNAGVFANGAVDILAAARAVTHLSFGAENPDCLTDSIIDMILEEPEPFKLSLKKHLAEGFSFVEARARAADEIIPGSGRVLAGSNNTLALAYMARIKKKSYALAPLPVKRAGAAYNSDELEEISSAAAIRRALRDGRTDEAFASMPEASARIFKRALAEGRLCLDYGNWWRLLRALLLRTPPEELRSFAEISEGIEYRLRDEALYAQSFEAWLDRCTSKRYPAGRLRRAAVHTALGLGHWFNRAAQRLGPPYIRPLAMNETGRALLHEMKKNAALPIVTTYGQASRLSPYAAECARFELLACELWEELIPDGRFGEEHKRRLIMG